MSAKILYVESPNMMQTTSTGNWDDISGLSLVLPGATSDAKYALIILNVPNPYAKGSDFPGGNFTIRVNTQIDTQAPVACFTSFSKIALPTGGPPGQSAGRVPTTLVMRLKLIKNKPIPIAGAWQSVRGATVVVDTRCSLTAILSEI